MPVRPDELLPRLEPLRKFRQRDPAIRYAVAVASVGLAILARLGLEGALSSSSLPFITFFPAIIVSSFLGGLRPGILSVLLSALAADYLFLPPLYSLHLSWGDAIAVAVFMGIGGFNVVLINLLNETIDHLAIQEQNTRLILETAPAGMLAVDANGIITLVNASVERLFGYGREELLGRSVEVLVPARLRPEHAQLRSAYMVLPTSRAMGAGRDLFGLQKGGAEVPVEIGLNPVVRENKTGALATIVDISERKAAEKKQQILVHEVQHRAKNLLASIQIIAARTLTDDRPLSESREDFLSKVQALARTQDLFFSSGKATLDGIVRGEMAGFLGQVSIDGVDVSLTPAAAQNFTLIIHELATNGLKYGALSGASGKVSIRWRSETGQLIFNWIEQDGPEMLVPTRQGFGHVILNDLPKGFGATVVSEYAVGGFRYGLRVAWGLVADQQVGATAAA
jgi:PAS domain S-box-containing protein